MFEQIIWPVIILGGLGGAFSIVLMVAARFFAVEADSRLEGIRELLPGANCGACGFAGCDGFAIALLEGAAALSGCSVCAAENRVAMADILGIQAAAMVRHNSCVMCGGGESVSKMRFEYRGMMDCAAASMLDGGRKSCSKGCLGLGTCVYTCKFDAIFINDIGVAEVDQNKCTGCGACANICPRGVIRMVDARIKLYCACSNPAKGKSVKQDCAAGCTACGLCEKNCHTNAIQLVDNLPVFDYALCDDCGVCAEKCPVKCIYNYC